MAKELTRKQKGFCEIYLKTGNATQSYIDAGYKATTRAVADANARRLLGKDSVRSYMKTRVEELDSKSIADANEVLQYLTKVMRGEEEDQFGLDASLQDRTKAAELLGKRYRLFSDKLEDKETKEDKLDKLMKTVKGAL